MKYYGEPDYPDEPAFEFKAQIHSVEFPLKAIMFFDEVMSQELSINGPGWVNKKLSYYDGKIRKHLIAYTGANNKEEAEMRLALVAANAILALHKILRSQETSE